MYCSECEFSNGYKITDKKVNCSHVFYHPAKGIPPEGGCCFGKRKDIPTLPKDEDDIPGQEKLFDGF